MTNQLDTKVEYFQFEYNGELYEGEVVVVDREGDITEIVDCVYPPSEELTDEVVLREYHMWKETQHLLGE